MSALFAFGIWFGLGAVIAPFTYKLARKRHAINFPLLEADEGGHGYAIGSALTGILAGPLGIVLYHFISMPTGGR